MRREARYFTLHSPRVISCRMQCIFPDVKVTFQLFHFILLVTGEKEIPELRPYRIIRSFREDSILIVLTGGYKTRNDLLDFLLALVLTLRSDPLLKSSNADARGVFNTSY